MPMLPDCTKPHTLLHLLHTRLGPSRMSLTHVPLVYLGLCTMICKVQVKAAWLEAALQCDRPD
jgi:hypothetical protein